MEEGVGRRLGQEGNKRDFWEVGNILSGASRLQPVGQIQPSSDFINKVLLGQGHIYSFRYYFQLLLHHNGRIESLP